MGYGFAGGFAGTLGGFTGLLGGFTGLLGGLTLMFGAGACWAGGFTWTLVLLPPKAERKGPVKRNHKMAATTTRTTTTVRKLIPAAAVRSELELVGGSVPPGLTLI